MTGATVQPIVPGLVPSYAKREPVPVLIEQLEMLLAMAKSGDLTAIVYGGICVEDRRIANYCGRATLEQFVAASARLHGKVMREDLPE